MRVFWKRIANLFTVKSLVTLALTGLFVYLSARGHVSAEQFMTVFTVVIAFYFGTQTEKKRREEEEG